MENIIHQIWVGPYEIPNREKSFIQKTKEKNTQYKHILWTNENLPELPNNVKELFDIFERQKDYAHQADILRVFLVATYGGIYFDIDFDCIGTLDDSGFGDFDGIFCYHGGIDYTIPNGFFGGSKGNSLLNYMLQEVSLQKGGWYGPSWMGDTVKKYFGLSREVDHSIVDLKFKEANLKYLLFPELENRYLKHHALYSWSPENKKNFEIGNIDYL